MKAHRVLEILPGNRAIVSTRGLRRVIIQPGDEVFKELISIERAKLMVETFNECSRGHCAVAVPYTAAKADRRASKSASK